MLFKSVKWISTLGFLFFLSVNLCFSEGLELAENLINTTKNFIIKNVPVESGDSIEVQVNLPTQLRVSACSQAIVAAFPKEMNASNVSAVELSCTGVSSWHVMVPVIVEINTPVLVAAHMVNNKEIITENDITVAMHDKNRLFSGYYKNKEEVIGMEASQMVGSGAVLTKQNLRSPILVHRNQAIDLIATRGSIVVMAKGIAKTDGRINETIKAFNPSTKKVLDAVVIGENRVEVIG